MSTFAAVQCDIELVTAQVRNGDDTPVDTLNRLQNTADDHTCMVLGGVFRAIVDRVVDVADGQLQPQFMTVAVAAVMAYPRVVVDVAAVTRLMDTLQCHYVDGRVDLPLSSMFVEAVLRRLVTVTHEVVRTHWPLVCTVLVLTGESLQARPDVPFLDHLPFVLPTVRAYLARTRVNWDLLKLTNVASAVLHHAASSDGTVETALAVCVCAHPSTAHVLTAWPDLVQRMVDHVAASDWRRLPTFRVQLLLILRSLLRHPQLDRALLECITRAREADAAHEVVDTCVCALLRSDIVRVCDDDSDVHLTAKALVHPSHVHAATYVQALQTAVWMCERHDHRALVMEEMCGAAQSVSRDNSETHNRALLQVHVTPLSRKRRRRRT